MLALKGAIVKPTPAEMKAKFSEYDIVVMIDKSGSMATADVGGNTRWKSMQETMGAVTRLAGQVDDDGLDVVLFGGLPVVVQSGVTAEKVDDLFASYSPSGSTPLTEALAEAFKLAGKSAKKDIIICFTDGEPNDKNSVASSIVAQSKLQEQDDDLTILFIQVGKDAGATKYLQQLDDNLTGAKFDIVDVKTVAEVDSYASIEELLYDAVTG